MRKFIGAIIIIFIFTAGVFSMDNEQAIRELYSTMYQAMIEKDPATLNDILDESFVLVHMTGMKQSKHEYISAISSGVLNYYSEHTEHTYIIITGDRAELTGQSRVEAAVFGGGRHPWRLQLDIELKREGGRWFMTHASASTY